MSLLTGNDVMQSGLRLVVTKGFIALMGFVLSLGMHSLQGQTLVISEFMASNEATLANEQGEFADWVEIHNYGDEAVDLAGLYLTDSRKKLSKWELGPAVVQPGHYQIVWSEADGGELQLGAKGDYLALIAADGKTVLHDFGKKYPDQKKDISFGLLKAWKPGKRLDNFAAFLLEPTPGRENSDALRGIAENVTLSHKRGFYEEPFLLTLTSKTPGVSIRYTTDGSVPSMANGDLYENPFEMKTTTVLRVAAFRDGFRPSKVKTHTFIFSGDVAQQSPDGLPPEGWPYMWGANQVDYGIDPDVMNDPRFGNQFEEGLESIPSISLVASLDDLFDEKNGIYSNAWEDGREWERPCSMEILDVDGEETLQVDAGLRIRGGFSRQPLNSKHAFRVFFRDVYGSSKLKTKLFPDGEGKSFDNIDLRTFQNYSWSYQRDSRAIFLRDQFNRDLQLALGHPAARGEYYHLFLNGQYWGLYNTCERPKASYGVTYFGGKKKHFDAVKKGREEGSRINVMATDGNLEAWQRLWEQAKDGLESNTAYLKLLGQNPDGSENEDTEVLLDPENLIDYMLIIFYGGNLDAPVTYFAGNRGANNWHSIYHRKGREGFQFFVWDAEHTFLDVDEDRTGPFPAGNEYASSNPQYIWQQCLANAEFRILAADRIHRAFFNGGVLSAPSIRARFLKRAEELETAVVCESARWGDVIDHFPAHNRPDEIAADRVFNPLDWQREIDRIANDYMLKRSDIVLGQLYAQGLWPDLTPPKLNRFGGKVQQGFKMTLEHSSEQGQIYFTLDGTDPRRLGGEVSGRALAYHQPVPIDQETEVKARAYHDGEWSALTHATFTIKR